MIREELLRHFVTVITPGTVSDTYDNTALSWDTDDGAVETEMRAWVQQIQAREAETTSGDRLATTWLIITNQPLDGQEHVTWNGDTYRIDGAPAPLHNRAGIHHWEATLKRVEG